AAGHRPRGSGRPRRTRRPTSAARPRAGDDSDGVNPRGEKWRYISDRFPRKRLEGMPDVPSHPTAVHVVIAEPASATDAALIAGSCERPEEFAALFDRHAAMVYRYVSKRLGPQVAEDLVGETFLAAF